MAPSPPTTTVMHHRPQLSVQDVAEYLGRTVEFEMWDDKVIVGRVVSVDERRVHIVTQGRAHLTFYLHDAKQIGRVIGH